MRVINDATGGPIAALLDRGEQHGCLDLSEVDELAQALEHAIGTRGSFQLIEAMIPRGSMSATLSRFVAGVKRLQAPKDPA